MSIRVTAPGGAVIEFPPGTDAETISSAMQQVMAGNTPEQPSPPQLSPIDQQAEAEVRAYRTDNPIMTRVDDTVRRLARGTGVGSWLDEGNARLSSVLPKALGGRPYDEAAAIERAKDRVGDAESTVVGRLPVIGDVSAAGLTKLVGGIASAPVTPMVRAVQGTTMLPRVANGAVNGGLYGMIYGAGEGEGDARQGNALAGLGIGLAAGGAIPVAASAVGNAAGAARNALARPPVPLQNYGRGAVNRMAQVAEQSGIDNAAIAQNGVRLGREGMLADMNGGMRDLTEAIAQQPGSQRQTIQTALNDRATGAPGRIRQELNRSLGPPADIDASVAALRHQFGAAAEPLYQQFYQTPIRMTEALTGILQRVPQSAYNRARDIMEREGIDPANAQNNGQMMDLIKRALDDEARAAPPGSNLQRVTKGLAAALRGEVDRVLSPNNPAQSVWAQARQIAGEGIGAREALEEGATVFSRKADPYQVRARLNGVSQFEQEAYRTGARSDLRNIMGRAATNFGPNGDAAVRRALNNDYNRMTIEEVAGPAARRDISGRIDAEGAFAETRNQVLANSATARRQAGRDVVPRQYDQSQMNNVRNSSVTGLMMEGVGRVANFMTANALNERNGRIAREMAEMLVSQGARRDEVARSLASHARQRGITRTQQVRIMAIARDMMRGAIPITIDAKTSQ